MYIYIIALVLDLAEILLAEFRSITNQQKSIALESKTLKGVTRSCKLKKDRQYNNQSKQAQTTTPEVED